MTEAPERIEAEGFGDGSAGVEYIRKDIADAAVAEERERCAQIADEHKARDWHEIREEPAGYTMAARSIAAAIREGET